MPNQSVSNVCQGAPSHTAIEALGEYDSLSFKPFGEHANSYLHYDQGLKISLQLIEGAFSTQLLEEMKHDLLSLDEETTWVTVREPF